MRTYAVLLLGETNIIDDLSSSSSKVVGATVYNIPVELNNGAEIELHVFVYDQDPLLHPPEPHVHGDATMIVTDDEEKQRKYEEMALSPIIYTMDASYDSYFYRLYFERIARDLYIGSSTDTPQVDRKDIVSQIRERMMEIEYLLTSLN